MAINDFPIGRAYTAPGFAVSSTLEDILAQRQAQARQQMIDSLNAQNIQSEMSYRQQQADSLAANRAAQARQRAAEALDSTAKHLYRNQDLSSINPDLLGQLVANGYATPATTPEQTASGASGINVSPGSRMLQTTPSGAVDPEANATGVGALSSTAAAPEPARAVGSIKENEDAQKQQDLLDASKIDWDKYTPIEKYLYGQAHGINIPEGIINQKQNYILGPDNKFIPAPNNATITRGFQPHEATQNTTPFGMTPDGKGIVFTDKHGNVTVKPLPEGVEGVTGKPRSPSPVKGNGVYDPALFSKYISLANGQNSNPDVVNQARMAVIGSIRDQMIKQDVAQIFTDPDFASKSSDTIVNSGAIQPPPGSSPEQAAAYLNTIRQTLKELGKQ